jgi:hypothetical protein
MTEQWKMVPVEPTEEMNRAGDVAYSWNVAKIYRAMLAAAPVPPASDVEVLAVAWIKVTRPDKRGNAYELDWYSAAERLPVGEYELVDEAHVTRLTAERDGLQAEVERQQNTIDGMNQTHAESVEHFQSELTKAREWPQADQIHQIAFEEGQPAENGDGYAFSAEEFDLFIERLIAHQSAPAAKDIKPCN